MTEIPKEIPFTPKPDPSKAEAQQASSQSLPPEVIHPDTTALHAPKRIIDLRTISFEVDPMVAHKIQMQMQDNPRFAQTINTNITKLFYDYIIYKVRMRENLNIAIKGETRSGKSTAALSLGHFISTMTKIPYTPYHICANESEYYSKVKNAKFGELYHIDEQKESKFGSGSFREEMGIMDIQNIIAKNCIHTLWLYPTDFIARNSVYGLETYGKDLKNKLLRCLVYDIRKTVMGMATPLGYVIIPKIQDPAYQSIPEAQWDKYRLKNKYELKRPDFDSLLEEDYEKKKDEWIEREKGREGAGFHHEERFKLGVWLGQQKQYKEQETKSRRRVLARQVFADLTEAEIDEIVVIADMGIRPEDVDSIKKKHQIDVRKDDSNR